MIFIAPSPSRQPPALAAERCDVAASLFEIVINCCFTLLFCSTDTVETQGAVGQWQQGHSRRRATASVASARSRALQRVGCDSRGMSDTPQLLSVSGHRGDVRIDRSLPESRPGEATPSRSCGMADERPLRGNADSASGGWVGSGGALPLLQRSSSKADHLHPTQRSRSLAAAQFPKADVCLPLC